MRYEFWDSSALVLRQAIKQKPEDFEKEKWSTFD